MLERLDRVAFGIVVVVAWASAVVAQPFHRTMIAPDTRANDVAQSAAGGYVTGGFTYEFPTFFQNVLVTKHRDDGAAEWSASFRSGDTYNEGTSVINAIDDGYVVAGLTGDFIFTPVPLGIGVAKLSGAGVLEWSFTYPGDGYQGNAFGLQHASIKKVNVGNFAYVVVGTRTIYDGKGTPLRTGGIVIGLDLNGAPIFERTYFAGPGPLQYEQPVAFTDVSVYLPPSPAEPELLITGAIQTPFFVPDGLVLANEQVLYVRLDLAGNVLVARSYDEAIDSTSVFANEQGLGIDVTPVGVGQPLVAIGGVTRGGLNGEPGLALALDLNGNVIWSTIAQEMLPAYAATKWDDAGNVVIAGRWFFGDGGRASRLWSLDSAGSQRFLYEYTPSYNNGLEGVVVHRGDPMSPVAYVAAGDVFDFGDFSSHLWLVGTTAGGRTVRCEYPLFPGGVPPMLVVDIPFTYEATQLIGPWAAVHRVMDAASTQICCIADVDDGSGSGVPDGGVTIEDLLYYLFIFESGEIAADVDDGSGTGTPDGGVTIEDLLYYLLRFESGC